MKAVSSWRIRKAVIVERGAERRGERRRVVRGRRRGFRVARSLAMSGWGVDEEGGFWEERRRRGEWRRRRRGKDGEVRGRLRK